MLGCNECDVWRIWLGVLVPLLEAILEAILVALWVDRRAT
jgi:hypothetical protein